MSVKTSTKTPIVLAAAMTMALASATVASPAQAAEMEMEKCYGVAKAGHNDCQTANGSCAGTSKMDRAKDAFVAVPKGTCAKIAGGSTEPGM